jgi:hypothetical protein
MTSMAERMEPKPIWMLENNKAVIEACKQYPYHQCYECPECGLLTYGKGTSWHATIHGEQKIFDKVRMS